MKFFNRILYGIILVLPFLVAGALVFFLSRPIHTHTAWNALVDEFLDDAYFKIFSTLATQAGIHKYNQLLEDYSNEGIVSTIDVLRKFEKRVAAQNLAKLTQLESDDCQILLGKIRSMLLTFESLRPWQNDPDYYSTGITKSIYSLLRPFAPSIERLRLVIARERQVPKVFSAARANLKNPPRIHTELALAQLTGNIKFFTQDLPRAFQEVSDPKIKEEFAQANAAVITALTEYESWLRLYLLDRSNGDFRIGAENLSKKLLYDEMITMPLSEILQIGWNSLRKNQAEFARIAQPKSSNQALELLEKMHQTSDNLLQAFKSTFDNILLFVRKKNIITIPPGPHPIVRQAPPIDLTSTTVNLDTPGPFETVATHVYVDVTLPSAHDSPEQIDSYLRTFNIGTILSTSIHETYPGHYTQYLWRPFFPSKIRKIFSAMTNEEGWACYCEQMMLEEGYGQIGFGAKDEHEAALIPLGFLQEMLLRDARLIVAISMHTGTMTFEEAVTFFENESYTTHANAIIEAQRGITDPLYLCYALGRLEIMKLRDDYKKKLGSAFTLEKFHNAFIKQGCPPLSIVRKAFI